MQLFAGGKLFSTNIQYNTVGRGIFCYLHHCTPWLTCLHSNLAAMCIPALYIDLENVVPRSGFPVTAALIQTSIQHHDYGGLSHNSSGSLTLAVSGRCSIY